ncbi:(2Fe-2S)-binding protein [Paenibacillus qinlingensis]|uniref:Ferric iron reductase protein FhuF n=1 Tax=Paenibacillus qinlingensis TaxID=1837343 RepID=A0ABU1P2C2_9BACL|nr:(2Fe-2S)-binding protein [Paenibacillus qinlingensis]MDR6553491.1 ferric iron reductase protein FhuF [Paenibacillus qinlingensis]
MISDIVTSLKHYHLLLDSSESLELIREYRLDDEKGIAELLEQFAEQIGAPNHKIASSLFVKRYSHFITGAWDAWVRYGRCLNVSPSNVAISLKNKHLYYRLLFPYSLENWAGSGSYAVERESYARHLFTDHAQPFLKQLVDWSGIDVQTLWATISYNLIYYRDEWRTEAETASEKAYIADNFRYLIHEANPIHVFAAVANPLTDAFRCVDIPGVDEDKIMIRSKCCLHFRMPGEDNYCYTCPTIKDDRRIDKYFAHMAHHH